MSITGFYKSSRNVEIQFVLRKVQIGGRNTNVDDSQIHKYIKTLKYH